MSAANRKMFAYAYFNGRLIKNFGDEKRPIVSHIVEFANLIDQLESRDVSSLRLEFVLTPRAKPAVKIEVQDADSEMATLKAWENMMLATLGAETASQGAEGPSNVADDETDSQ